MEIVFPSRQLCKRTAAPASRAGKAAAMLPTHSRYVIVGAGIHGLSTAFHLARELRVRGLGSGADVLGIDQRAIAAGASGIACGVVRHNYFQPAMPAPMAHSASDWYSE